MAKRLPEGPAPEPVVQRLRLQYAKRGRLRFSSARDFQRALERALRRSGVPVAFSAGFHPHPRISYAGAAPTGTASEAEYFELLLREVCDPEEVRARLDAALPDGLDVVRACEALPGALADRLEASEWRLEFVGAESDQVESGLRRLLEREQVEVTRMMKRGPRTFDVRAAVLDASVSTSPHGAVLRLVLRHDTPAVRPDDVLTALRDVGDSQIGEKPLMTRLRQGPLGADGQVCDPLVAPTGD